MLEAERITRHWLMDAVLGLELCPFAASVVADSSLRIAVVDAETFEQGQRDFLLELDHIQSKSESECLTSLLVWTRSLTDFNDFLDFLAWAQDALTQLDLEDQFQLASFHPHYCFEGSADHDLSNYTNRSPLPTLHILRQATLTRVLSNYPDPELIPERNIARINTLGERAVQELWRSFHAD